MRVALLLLLLFIILSSSEKCNFVPGPPDNPHLCWPVPGNDPDYRFPLKGKCTTPSIYMRNGIFQCYNFNPTSEEVGDWNTYYAPFSYEQICDTE